MTQIEWDDTFSVGNDTIDRQHRKWVELYNNFDKAMSSSSPIESPGMKLDALQLLHEYTLYHFRYEENLMAKLGYPGLANHWRLHKDFDYKVFAYIRKLETGKLISTDVLDMLHKWIIDHIRNEDSRIHQFLKLQAKAENCADPVSIKT